MFQQDAEPNGQSEVREDIPKKRAKLHGRAFYESIGSPKIILAPMVQQSEFAWRMLTRSYLPPSSSSQSPLLAYSPMFHSRMFVETQKYRDSAFQPLASGVPSPPSTENDSSLPPEEPYLDGNPAFDRPLTVQFCSNDPDDLFRAASYVAPFCDAVDLNLGCPQGIAKSGNYGAFLQEDWGLIGRMISRLHEELDVPVTAKMRILETKKKTLKYASMILEAGASIITVHGRRREQKGHNTGLADWSMIRYLRDNLPKDTVIFANGNILQPEDIERCLRETGADGVMSAEGNLYDPTIFAIPPPIGEEGREYWRGRDGKGGYRMDAVFRRYMDIIHKHALGQEPPQRSPLFLPSDPPSDPPPQNKESNTNNLPSEENHDQGPPRKKRKEFRTQSERKKQQTIKNPNLTAMQSHLFHLMRPLVSQHHNVRDALAQCRVGDIDAFEHVLTLTEKAVRQGLLDYDTDNEVEVHDSATPITETALRDPDPSPIEAQQDPYLSSLATVARCKRPWWVCQPYVRPLPKEAYEKGSMQLSKKEKQKQKVVLEEAESRIQKEEDEVRGVGLEPGGRVERVVVGDEDGGGKGEGKGEVVEVPREGMVCG